MGAPNWVQYQRSTNPRPEWAIAPHAYIYETGVGTVPLNPNKSTRWCITVAQQLQPLDIAYAFGAVEEDECADVRSEGLVDLEETMMEMIDFNDRFISDVLQPLKSFEEKNTSLVLSKQFFPVFQVDKLLELHTKLKHLVLTHVLEIHVADLLKKQIK